MKNKKTKKIKKNKKKIILPKEISSFGLSTEAYTVEAWEYINEMESLKYEF